MPEETSNDDPQKDEVKNQNFNFPKNFLWGAGSSSLQVENNLDNDWSHWITSEQDKLRNNIKERFKKAKNFFGTDPIWENLSDLFEDKDNFNIYNNPDFLNKYKEDFKLAKDLGHNATRFSIEWSRVQPTRDSFNQEAINKYVEMINNLAELGIEPIVTLWHFSLPVWFAEMGGWKNKEAPNLFAEYAAVMVKAFGDKVKFYITINEPLIALSNSYIMNTWPPHESKFISFISALRNVISAHKQSYKAIKRYNQNCMVGMAHHYIYFEAHKQKLQNRIVKGLCDLWNNKFLVSMLLNFQDFIGINHYNHIVIDNGFNKNKYTSAISDLGWELYPEGLYQVIKIAANKHKPILITEHGLADKTDTHRAYFIEESIRYIAKAMTEGANVIGYLHWSLTDNFELELGKCPRFGLIEVNYNTLERKARPSAYAYAAIIRENKTELP